MVTSTSVEVTHKVVDGWHIFETEDMPGFYVANRDPRRAFNAIGPAIEQLVKLDTGLICTAIAEVPFAKFIGAARSELTVAASHQRFNIFQAAA